MGSPDASTALSPNGSHGGVDAGSSYASCRREPVGVTPYLLGIAGAPLKPRNRTSGHSAVRG